MLADSRAFSGFAVPDIEEARKGALELIPGASRGLRLREQPGVPAQGTLPLVGRVAAGQPILAAEHVAAR